MELGKLLISLFPSYVLSLSFFSCLRCILPKCIMPYRQAAVLVLVVVCNKPSRKKAAVLMVEVGSTVIVRWAAAESEIIQSVRLMACRAALLALWHRRRKTPIPLCRLVLFPSESNGLRYLYY